VANIDSLPGQGFNHREEPFWGDSFSQEDFVYFPGNCQLGFEPADAPPGGSEIDLLVSTQAIDLAVVDLVLFDPVVDGRLADSESLGEPLGSGA